MIRHSVDGALLPLCIIPQIKHDVWFKIEILEMGGDGECKGNGRERPKVRGAVRLDDEVDLHFWAASDQLRKVFWVVVLESVRSSSKSMVTNPITTDGRNLGDVLELSQRHRDECKANLGWRQPLF